MRKLLSIALAAFIVATPLYAQNGLPGGPGAQIPNSSGGGGGGGGSGTVTQIDTACGVSGGPITTTGTIQGAAVVRANSGTTDTILSSDCGKVVTESNAASVAVTLPQATGAFGAPFFYTQVNLGVGTVTITPTTSTINGAATLVLTTGQSADIVSDGTNYVAALGKGGSATTDASLLTSGTLAAARMPAITGGDCTSTVGTVVLNCDMPHPGYAANEYSLPGGITVDASGTNVAANTIYCTYGFMPKKVTIGTLLARIGTAGSTNLQLAVYANSSGFPGALIASTGNIANTAGSTVVSGVFAGSVTKQVGPGGTDGGRDLWWCFNNGDSTATFNVVATNSTVAAGYVRTNTLANILGSSAVTVVGKSCAGANCNGGSSTLGTWPATLAGTTWSDVMSGVMPAIGFRVVSFP